MKIAYILTTFPHRSEIFARREVEQLSRLGIDVTVFAAAGQKQPPVPLRGGSVVRRPPFFSMRSLLSTVYLFVKYPLGIIKLVSLIFKLISLNPLEARLIASNIHTVAFFARILDKESIPHVHAYFLNWPSCIAMALAIVTRRTFSIAAHARDLFVERGAVKLKISYACFIVTCTKYGSDYLKRRLSATLHDRLRLSYHGVNMNLHSTSKDFKDTYEFDKCRLVAIGRLVPKKGFDYLIKAFSLVCQSFQDCILFIAGDGSEYGRLSTLVDKSNLKNRVRLLGWLDHNSAIQLISSSTILVAPSIIAVDDDRDGIPNVILEAFVCGTPVVASRLAGIGEAVKHGDTGLLVDSCDVEQLANTIKTLLSDHHLREKLSQNAFETAKQKFDIEKNIKQLATFFSEVDK